MGTDKRPKREPKYVKAKLPQEYRCWTDEIPLHDADFSLKAEIDSFLLKKREEVRESTGWIYPSSLAKCERAALYDLHAGTPGREQRTALDKKLGGIGDAIHGMLQTWAVEALGADEFDAELPVRLETQKLSMRLDGVLKLRDWILEIKTLGDSGYNSLRKPREEDLFQVHCYMFALDIPRAILYYFNRNTGEDCEFKVFFNASIWQAALDAIGRVMRHLKEGTKPTRLKSKFWCQKCRYYEYCMKDA